MYISTKPKVVVLGMTSKMPFAGIVFLVAQYLVGLKQLGFDVYYVEAHGQTPWMLMADESTDGSIPASRFIADMMQRFDLGVDHWAFQALHADGRCYGMPEEALKRLYRDAALILNLHGGTVPLTEHFETGRLVYVGTDPVEHEVALYNGDQSMVDYLAPHCAFFTWGENYGNSDCLVPTSDRFRFIPTRQPIVSDFWEPFHQGPADTFTTIGNWRQLRRPVQLNGELYYWSKHLEFAKFIDLPRRCGQMFELALVNVDDDDRRLLELHRWGVRESAAFTTDLDAYREYIGRSRAEFTVAKDQNIRLRSGWFSDRSASYLACGRPVVTQETGFSNILPTGEGLFGFSTMEEAEDAVARINVDYPRHCAAAATIAREWFDYRTVLGAMLDHLDCRPSPARWRHDEPGTTSCPDDLVLTPVSRWPTTLSSESVRAVLDAPVCQRVREVDSVAVPPQVSIVVVTIDGLVFSRLCLESLLASRTSIPFEVIVLDNASTDGTIDYLRDLSGRDRRVRTELSERNLGFAAAVNRGLSRARGRILVLLNNDTIVVDGWLDRIVSHLSDESVGLLGAVTNCAGNEAEVETSYRTFAELQQFARDQAAAHAGRIFDIRTATMFCAALRRDVWEAVGALDERYAIGLFEDDDYAMRVRRAGRRVACAEDVFVHHFGQASIGRLGPTGEYGALFHANRRRWEAKWGMSWQPHDRRVKPSYQALVERVRRRICQVVPPDATVLVISKGDDQLLELESRRGWHFPQCEDGTYAGCYPANDDECIAELERLRAKGAEYLVIPASALWWLEHYRGFARHVHANYRVRRTADCAVIMCPAGLTLPSPALAVPREER